MSKSNLIAELRTQMEAVEVAQTEAARAFPGAGLGGGLHAPASAALPFGIREIDYALPGGGLKRAEVHEVAPARYGDLPAAWGWLLGFLSHQASAARKANECAYGQAQQTVLWCYKSDSIYEFGAPYSPGWDALGLRSSDFIFAECRHSKDVLWAAEEGAKCSSLAFVVAYVSDSLYPDELTAVRRLQLACHSSGVTLLLLREKVSPSANGCSTRWQIASCASVAPAWAQALQTAPGGLGVGPPRFQATLTRCRNGKPGQWEMEWDGQAHCFHLVSTMADRPVFPQSSPGQSRRLGRAQTAA